MVATEKSRLPRWCCSLQRVLNDVRDRRMQAYTVLDADSTSLVKDDILQLRPFGSDMSIAWQTMNHDGARSVSFAHQTGIIAICT